MELSQAVILVAGYARRARPLSNNIPKPLFPVGESCGLEYAIQLILALKIEPIVVIGYKADQVKHYLDDIHPGLKTVQIEDPSTNLLDSVAKCEKILSSPNFLWIGGGMFFEQTSNIRRLIARHKETEAFCTMFSQTDILYKPKLVIQEGRLRKFIVGEHKTPISTPTAFAVSKDFLKYAKVHDEHEVFQVAINDGRKFEIVELHGWSEEIHTIFDYYSVSSRIYPNGYYSSDSKITGTTLRHSFVYGSSIDSCDVDGSIIINSTLSNEEIKDRLIYRNSINEPIEGE